MPTAPLLSVACNSSAKKKIISGSMHRTGSNLGNGYGTVVRRCSQPLLCSPSWTCKLPQHMWCGTAVSRGGDMPSQQARHQQGGNSGSN